MDVIGTTNQIPKVIHYCWFGGNPLPDYAKKCINSWKKYCPDYEIIQWNESNYDVNKIPFMKEAYEHKKWGFVPDYARLDIIYNHGGIYLDTDVELLKNLDFALNDEGFCCYETDNSIAFGLGFGAKKHNSIIKELMKYYETTHFVNENGSLQIIPSPAIQTNSMRNYGFKIINGTSETLDGFKIYEKEYFNPFELNTGRIVLTKNTVSIHHYKASWGTAQNKINTFISQLLYRMHLSKLQKILKKIHRKISSK